MGSCLVQKSMKSIFERLAMPVTATCIDLMTFKLEVLRYGICSDKL